VLDGHTQRFKFNFGDTFVDLSNPLTDKDMVASVALEETLCGRTSCQAQGCTLEPHKLGMPSYNPGPPFPVDDMILANVGKHGLLRAFVTKSDHLRYQLRLASGVTVDTSMQEAWLLTSRMAGMAPDQDDLFAKIREVVERGPLRLGSYGVNSDAQQELLHLVGEAKAFAMAVKFDDAEDPTHLWDDQILMAGMPQDQRDRALASFWELGFNLFRQGLVKDCCAFLSWQHGKDWMKGRQCEGNRALTGLGRDQDAISSMLWHLGHTSWFEFHAGSHLVHFRFLARYRREARDGVRAFFAKPDPTMWCAQPIIKDCDIRAKIKDKIDKVMRWRYLLPAGMPGMFVKLFIKYFALPKGEDDIRMVYNATVNKLNKAVWLPMFWLPRIDILVQKVGRDSWMTDCNNGNMFLNYQLHEEVRLYMAVDLTCLQDSPNEKGPEWAV
jgi:hypothetical protein